MNVDNENDETPVFQPVEYYGNITEGVSGGAFIEQVNQSKCQVAFLE